MERIDKARGVWWGEVVMNTRIVWRVKRLGDNVWLGDFPTELGACHFIKSLPEVGV